MPQPWQSTLPAGSFWRLYARIYHWTWDNQLSAELASEVASRLGPGHVCVEVGSGTGLTTRELIARGQRVTCVDLCQEMLRRGRDRRLPCASHVQATAAELPISSAAADNVVAVNLLQFLEDEQAVLVEFRRVAGSSGRVIVTRPAPDVTLRAAVRRIVVLDSIGALLRFLTGHVGLTLIRLLTAGGRRLVPVGGGVFESAEPVLGGLQLLAVLDAAPRSVGGLESGR